MPSERTPVAGQPPPGSRAADGALPSVIVIGAMKCGTTSLHHYLGLHPEISMTREKELNFFVEERNWSKGLAWYRSHFDGDTPHRGESSPNYTADPLFQGVPDRMYEVVPDARLIYLVRDPVERLVSEYVHRCAEGREDRPLEQAVERALREPARDTYVTRGLYAMQLDHYRALYDASQLLVIPTVDLLTRRAETLRRIFRFLEVDESFANRVFEVRYHRAGRKRRRSPTGERAAQLARARLLRRLPPDRRWNLEWLLAYPFSRRVERPELPDGLRARSPRSFGPTPRACAHSPA